MESRSMRRPIAGERTDTLMAKLQDFPFSSGEEEEEWVVGKIVNLTLDLFCLRAGLAFFVEGIPTLSC